MGKLYTRTGDTGYTSVHGGARVAKTDLRIEAVGTLDELNVAIGIVRSMMDDDNPEQHLLRRIQIVMMGLMSLVATPSEQRGSNKARLTEEDVAWLEHNIDRLHDAAGKSRHFVLPGGSRLSALLHQARVVSRRAERCLWRLDEADPVTPCIMSYVNRLSDLFFVMALNELKREGMQEERWRLFAVPAGAGASGCPAADHSFSESSSQRSSFSSSSDLTSS